MSLPIQIQNNKKAFNCDDAFARAFLAGMDKYYKLDSVRSGLYPTSAIGGNVDVVNRYLGLQLPKDNHKLLADAIGVPEQLIWLQGAVFDGFHYDNKRESLIDFAHALVECQDVTYVWQRHMIWLMQEELSQFKYDEIDMVASMYERWVDGDRPTDNEFSIAEMEVRGAINNESYMASRCALYAALNLSMSARLAGCAASAAYSAGTARGYFVSGINKECEEFRKSYQRQRDNLLKILRGEGK